MHHVIADGWSASILANDAKELYAAHLHGKPVALAPLKVQFADYAQQAKAGCPVSRALGAVGEITLDATLAG